MKHKLCRCRRSHIPFISVIFCHILSFLFLHTFKCKRRGDVHNLKKGNLCTFYRFFRVYFKTEHFQSLNFYVSIIMCGKNTQTSWKHLRRKVKEEVFFFTKHSRDWRKRICYQDLQTDMRFYPPYMFQSAHPPSLPMRRPCPTISPKEIFF